MFPIDLPPAPVGIVPGVLDVNWNVRQQVHQSGRVVTVADGGLFSWLGSFSTESMTWTEYQAWSRFFMLVAAGGSFRVPMDLYWRDTELADILVGGLVINGAGGRDTWTFSPSDADGNVAVGSLNPLEDESATFIGLLATDKVMALNGNIVNGLRAEASVRTTQSYTQSFPTARFVVRIRDKDGRYLMEGDQLAWLNAAPYWTATLDRAASAVTTVLSVDQATRGIAQISWVETQ